MLLGRLADIGIVKSSSSVLLTSNLESSGDSALKS